MTPEQLQELGAFLESEQVQTLLPMVLADLGYNPAEHGDNPLIFALTTIVGNYAQTKEALAYGIGLADLLKRKQEIDDELQSFLLEE